MKAYTLASVLILVAGSAFAAGSGDHSHDEGLAVGQPGNAAEVDRTVEIEMMETDSGMAFEPSELEVEEGETIRFAVTNTGYLEHEIVFGTEESNLAHMAEMAGMDQMDHDDPNALSLAPEEEGELIWTFSNAGTFQFACLIPGHMQAGMHGPITVN
ncbi:cupredoxin domain-containing protein [Histidinibacterium aquaticum]|uniref:Cupredoxin family protein n=1 Tax=Histidinibacterium aquaticum TaxID=2613962 RepID=A0A5J5GML3_9RHOB|nr:cupredoxin family protein [Histidinibacterium aquaticum]KAA9008848.1 cupredoxin family protein [Histidinibacterium aquaticum]